MRAMWMWLGCGVICLGLLACESKPATPEGGEKAEQPVAAPAAEPLPGDPVAGEAVYTKTCLACHGADGKGNGGITGANFIDDKTRLAKSNDELLTSIREGKQGKTVSMPAQKDLMSEQEMKDALSYIRQKFGGTP